MDSIPIHFDTIWSPYNTIFSRHAQCKDLVNSTMLNKRTCHWRFCRDRPSIPTRPDLRVRLDPGQQRKEVSMPLLDQSQFKKARSTRWLKIKSVNPRCDRLRFFHFKIGVRHLLNLTKTILMCDWIWYVWFLLNKLHPWRNAIMGQNGAGSDLQHWTDSSPIVAKCGLSGSGLTSIIHVYI